MNSSQSSLVSSGSGSSRKNPLTAAATASTLNASRHAFSGSIITEEWNNNYLIPYKVDKERVKLPSSSAALTAFLLLIPALLR